MSLSLYATGAFWIFLFGGILVAALVGAVRATEQKRTSTSGWVYFVGTDDAADPIKIGTTRRDPRNDRLPEIESMSPNLLHVIYCFRAGNAEATEAAVHQELARYRHHGEWFDRDATLSYIDGLVKI